MVDLRVTGIVIVTVEEREPCQIQRDEGVRREQKKSESRVDKQGREKGGCEDDRLLGSVPAVCSKSYAGTYPSLGVKDTPDEGRRQILIRAFSQSS